MPGEIKIEPLPELTDEMIRAALAVQWPALYRDGLYTPFDGPQMSALTRGRAEVIRKQWAAIASAIREGTSRQGE